MKDWSYPSRPIHIGVALVIIIGILFVVGVAKADMPPYRAKTYKVAYAGWPITAAHLRNRVAHKKVHVKCFPKELVAILARVEKKYGRKVVITSGYRSKKHNRRVRGARRSLHMSCKAADIKVPGVNKFKLAKYVKGLRGRGGVGTYCRSSFIHVDVGRKRNWHWRCRRKKK
jgi:uncharacterized protein YcbK (DUF882 family)